MRKLHREPASLALMRIVSIGVIGLVTVLAVGSPVQAKPANPFDRAAAVADAVSAENGVRISTDAVVSVDPAAPAASLAGSVGDIRLSVIGAARAVSEMAGGARGFRAEASDTDFAVRPLEDGAQILSIMTSAAAPTTQRYLLDLPAGVSLTPAGGGFLLRASDGEVVGAIAEPWAVDATGRHLPTSYFLAGRTLVQHTDTEGATFPVIADPKLTYGWGVYLNAWGSEIKAYVLVAVGVVGITCAGKALIPNAILKALVTLLCTVGGVNPMSVIDAMKTVYYSSAFRTYLCYQSKIYGPGAVSQFVVVPAHNCP